MPRMLWIPLSLFVLAIASSGFAQDGRVGPRREAPNVVPTQDTAHGMLTPTPEMWFYEQERLRHDDPKMAIRQRAEIRGQQRQDRIASMQWFGMSNSRPNVSGNPYSTYAPHWASNSFDPYRWRQTTYPLVVMRPRDAY